MLPAIKEGYLVFFVAVCVCISEGQGGMGAHAEVVVC